MNNLEIVNPENVGFKIQRLFPLLGLQGTCLLGLSKSFRDEMRAFNLLSFYLIRTEIDTVNSEYESLGK